MGNKVCAILIGVGAMKVGIIGAGNLGKALIRNASKRAEVIAVKRRIEKIDGAKVTQNLEDVAECDVIIVSLKPDVFRENLKKIGEVADRTPVVSFAAGVKINEMEKYITKPYRAMTNLAIEERSIVACYPPETEELLTFLDAEFLKCESEDELDVMTTYIGSSPAMLSYLIHSFALAALRDGVKFDRALRVAIHAFESAAMLYAKYGLEKVVEKIATPGGTTVEGIVNLSSVQQGLIDALLASSSKARKL